MQQIRIDRNPSTSGLIPSLAIRGLLADDYFERIQSNPALWSKIDDCYTFMENMIDLPLNVALGTADFKQWQAQACERQREICERIPLSKPVGFDFIKEYDNAYGHMKEYRLAWNPDNPLHGSAIGGTLAMPKDYNGRKPLIVFIHGHGMVRNYAGEYRSDLFAIEDLANEIIKRGYPLWAPDNVYHDELLPMFAEHDYPDMWAKVSLQSWELLRPHLPATRRRYAIGLAGGACTALSLALNDASVDGLVAAGAFYPLDLLRRDYRLKGHPLCIDFRHYTSNLPLYAMALGRPLMIQQGRDDGLLAGHPNPPRDGWYSGLKRPVLTEESVGPMLILESLAKRSGQSYSFKLTNVGHERMDFAAAFEFIEGVNQ